MVNPEVWGEVPDEHVEPSEFASKGVQDGSDDQQAEIAEQDQLGVLGLVQWAVGVEMIDAAEETVTLALSASLALTFMEVMAGNIGEKVHGPSKELLENHVDDGMDGSLLGEFIELVDQAANARSICLSGLGDKDHVTLHVSGSLVVLSVGDLPGEVWHEQRGVQDPANGVIEDLGGRERLMAALVSQHPDTGSEQTLDESVQRPEDEANWSRGDSLGSDIVVEDVEGGSKTGNVSQDILHAAEAITLVAVGWNGITDLLDGEVWQLELVAISVDQLADSGVLLVFRFRGERRIRCRHVLGSVQRRGSGGAGGGRGRRLSASGSSSRKGGRGHLISETRGFQLAVKS